MAEKAPDVAESAVKQVAKETGAPDLYFQSGKLVEVLETTNTTLEAFAEKVDIPLEQLQEQIQAGGDVIIPTEKFVVGLSMTELREPLSWHLRMRQNQMSFYESQQLRAEFSQIMTKYKDNPSAALQKQLESDRGSIYAEERQNRENSVIEALEANPELQADQKQMEVAKQRVQVMSFAVRNLAQRAGIKPENFSSFAPAVSFAGEVKIQTVQAQLNAYAYQQALAAIPHRFRQAAQKIKAIFDRVKSGVNTSGRGRDSFADYAAVSDRLVRDAANNGFDLKGFSHTIIDGNLSHVLNKHGEGTERERQQVGLTEIDLLRLPEVVADYDKIEFGATTKMTGHPAIRYIKTFSDGTQYVVEEIRTGRKKLSLQTAYKKATPILDAQSQRDRPLGQRPRRTGVDSYPSLGAEVDGVNDGFNQALPTAKSTGKNVDIEDAKADQKQYETNAELLVSQAGLKSQGTLDEQVKTAIARMKTNLVKLYKLMPEDARNTAKLWYEGGRKMLVTMSRRYGITPQAMAAVIAVMSPQKDWMMNMTAAERLADIVTHCREKKWTSKMTYTVSPGQKAANGDLLAKCKGKTLQEVIVSGDYRAAAFWVRWYDEAYNEKNYKDLYPDGREAGLARGSRKRMARLVHPKNSPGALTVKSAKRSACLSTQALQISASS